MQEIEQPRNEEAERWFIGAASQRQSIIAKHSPALAPEDFYLEKHQLIWQAMLLLSKNGEEANPASIITEIKKTGRFHCAFNSSESYIYDIIEHAPSFSEADYQAKEIAECSVRRKILAMHKTLLQACDLIIDPFAITADIIEQASRINGHICKTEAVHISESAEKPIALIEQIQEHGGSPCVKAGFWELDGITGGLRNGELTVVGARPGVGKTSFALDIALNVACLSKNVLMFSIEMTEHQLASRAMSYYSEISLKGTVEASLLPEDLERQKEAKALLKSVPLRVFYERNITANQICSLSHSHAAKHPLSLVIVDHLQIVNVKDSAKNYENRNIALGEVTRKLKILSGELNCPVVALSQLNRDFEKTGMKLPKLSDLRDSGNIEQDADCVMLMHRLTKSTENRDIRETDIIVAKNRSGPTGDVKLYFDTNTTRFKERQC
jgi:replicative DNA helicase